MTNTVDKKEIEQFSSLSNKWWDLSGPFSALHKMSNARIEFIKQNAIRVFKKQKIGVNLLDGLNCFSKNQYVLQSSCQNLFPKNLIFVM